MKKYILAVSVSFLFFSCQSENNGKQKTNSDIEVKSGEVKSKLSSGSQDPEALKEAAERRKQEEEAREQERLASQTTMEIFPESYDFGEIEKETPVSTIFKIKNTGTNPLIIDNAEASCGCTVPRKPEHPILPGEEDELEVTFTSNPGQEGTVVNKTVTISANIPGATKVVSIKSKVKE